MSASVLRNYVAGEWRESKAAEALDVHNPATDEVIARVPLSTHQEVDEAVRAAQAAFAEWRATPPSVRVQYLFRLKALMEECFEDLARTITREEGKTLDEARGEVRRTIENIEVAAGIPSLMMGYNLEDVATGIDEEMVRQPLGVFAMVPPFNFPAMVPWWFAPTAIATGNTYIVKPSERVPCSQNRIFELVEKTDLPPGVLNLVNGGKQVVDWLLEHPGIVGVSSVTSTRVAKHIYRKATEHGKRAQCQAGAFNFLVVMPDADLDRTVPALITSCFGCAGERCLSGAVVMPVGDIYQPLKARFVEAAAKLKVGDPSDETVQMGPVISKQAKERMLFCIERGLAEGAELILEGRNVKVHGSEKGYFIGPTIFDNVKPEMAIAREEIFGPVRCIMKADSLDQAIGIIHDVPFGNAASIFTASGAAAREFKYRVMCGNIGINIGVPAPVAYFPFGGRKESFFGDLHGQGLDAVDFFTEKKIVISRWGRGSEVRG
jgi:malonate-semialdehyde dehydrogenase (acetylating)/methylmalonate-semialdehyde dehydrogenase